VPDGPSRTDPSHPYYDVARHGIIQVSGDDNYGRKLIVFSSCCLPPSHQLNHRRLLEYLKFTLDQYVEMDYILVYFHYGIRSSNKPSLKWLREAYGEFDRKSLLFLSQSQVWEEAEVCELPGGAAGTPELRPALHPCRRPEASFLL
uniref:CRAL-TRIO domain-containing protein n=1 Tax=Xiphophorus couchianus TaxID=32473 RepID=A0A3B5M2U4_9TELE